MRMKLLSTVVLVVATCTVATVQAQSEVIQQATKFLTAAFREGLRTLTPETARNPELLRAAAENGNAAAMVTLVVNHSRGKDGFKQDETAARLWADRAAERSAWEGPMILAFLHEGREGTPRRYPLARE